MEERVSATNLGGVDQALMTLRQAADRTGLSTTTLRRYIKSGRVKARLIPGRYGPEYVVADDDLEGAGLAQDGAEGVALSPLPRRPAVEPAPPAPAVSTDLVPGMLYRELLMKHEQLLVQVGMLRAGGRQLYENRQEMERKADEAARANGELERVRERHAREIGMLKTRLRQAELALAERDEEIQGLRRELLRQEMAQRNASTLRSIEREFARRVADTPSSPPAAPLSPAGDH